MDSKTYISALEKHGHEKYQKYAPYRVNVPYGKSGPWEVKELDTEMGLEYLRLARDNRQPGLGRFTRLVHQNRGTVMSDTCAEIDDLRYNLSYLRGNVLISGLGLGMTLHILTKHPSYQGHVTTLTVLEKDEDVIKLVADHYRKSDPRITIHHTDAYEWAPPKGAFYDAAWHDIWDNICEDNREGMTKLRRKYQRCIAKGKQFCWGQEEMSRHKSSRW